MAILQDKWRQQFIKLVNDVKYTTSEQMSLMMQHIGWGSERIEAVMLAFGRIVDPENMHLVMKQLMPQVCFNTGFRD